MASVKIKLLISRGGDGFVQNAGDEIDVGTDEAQRMIAAGQALPVRQAPPPEKAVARRGKSAEKAAR